MLIKYPQNIFFILFLINITPLCFTAAGIPESEYDPMLPIEEEEGEVAQSAYYRQNRHRDLDDELNSPDAKILSPKSNPGILSYPELLFSFPPRNTEDLTPSRLQQDKEKENTEPLAAPEILLAPSSAGIASPPPLRHFSKRKSELFLEADDNRESKTLKLSPQEVLNSDTSLVEEDTQSSSAKTYVCEICKKQSATKWHFNQHMRIHTGDKPFPCTECGKKFTQKQNLTRHMFSHTGKGPLACTKCDQKFPDNSSLTRHMRTHTGERPFPCTECDQKFTQKSSLKRHMSTHTDENTFACTECDQKFPDNLRLKRHMRIHTGERPFTCTECDQKFTERSSLKRHMRTHE